ncbi:MAG: hypothetical protein ACLFWF_06740, partial [Alphaproteobacteria bacterium]
MKVWAQAAIGVLVLALAAAWPFWHARTGDRDPGPAAEHMPAAISPVSGTASSVPGASGDAEPPDRGCSGCGALKRLARRLRAREAGAARRF